MGYSSKVISEGETRLETDFIVLLRYPGPFVHVISKPIDHNLEQAQFIMNFMRRAYEEEARKVCALVDMRAARSITRDARLEYQTKVHAEAVLGTALLVDSGISRVLGNFIIGLGKSVMSTRLFTSEQDARAWLDTLRHG